MGSIGTAKSPSVSYENIRNTPLIFATAAIRNDTIDIDGYSNKKTLKGALSDLAKALDKYNQVEADGLRDSIKNNEITQVNIGGTNYILEYEEVPTASQLNERTGEMEYKPAKWYVHTRIIK